MTKPFTLQNIKGLELTNTVGTISGACVTPIDTGGVCVNGFLAATVGVSAGTLRLTSGNVTDTGGSISFGDERLIGTGAVEFSGGVSLRGGVSINQFTFPSNIAPENNKIFKTDANGVISLTTNGGGGGTPSGNDTDIQFKDGGSFGGVSALQFHKSTTSGVSALTVDGNVFSRGLSVVESNESSGSVYNIPVENFVNGVVFPQYGTAGNEEHHVVKVPTLSHITTSYSDVLKDGQFFETLIYGTSTGVSNGLSTPADITVLSNTDVIFDTRLIKNRTPAYTGTGMSFHGATLWNGETYQGVVIKSRYTSTGVSMYPASTAFYN